jgi:radical SAM superfamily enzyme YgiQ (UPF0313 family)
MDLAVKEATNASNDEKIVTQDDIEMAKDSQTLKTQQFSLQAEMRDCMNSGDAAGVVYVQNLLRDLPVRITAAEINELNQQIEQTNERLAEIPEDVLEAVRIKTARNKILAEKLKIAEQAGLEVEKVNFILFQLGNEAESLRQARREYKQRLNKIIADAELQIADRK